MTDRAICEEPGCEAPAVVGWGPDPVRWVCDAHLRSLLLEVRARVRAVLEVLEPDG